METIQVAWTTSSEGLHDAVELLVRLRRVFFRGWAKIGIWEKVGKPEKNVRKYETTSRKSGNFRENYGTYLENLGNIWENLGKIREHFGTLSFTFHFSCYATSMDSHGCLCV